ncbi:MAG: hypothetical protein JWM49_2646 [Microbacteriaceae bacterium]|nr:hypothetical protein [Microbacteriaceae bacterium]
MSDAVPVDVLRVFTDENGGFGNKLGIVRSTEKAMELSFAGHPSVGVAWWLAAQGTPVGVLLEGHRRRWPHGARSDHRVLTEMFDRRAPQGRRSDRGNAAERSAAATSLINSAR